MMQGVGLVSPGMASPFRHPNQYYQKVKRIAGTSLLAYWPQWEIAGAVAHDISGNSPAGERDGAYTGVTLAQPGIGDGNLAPLYDGLLDFTDVFSAGLQGAFNGAEGTAIAWSQVSGAGVWTDAASRFSLVLIVDGGNRVRLAKNSANNQLFYQYSSGGVSKTITHNTSTILPFLMGVTWSEAVDEVRFYFNGIQTGATANGLGVFAGLLSATQTVIGAASTVPVSAWDGIAAHALVMGRPATPNEMRSFASLNDD